ncbi:hypothetical protein [Enterovibrio norvegicus]|uniref:hypothetical protein n=1 Tax=Enterovibrio norvegicus TaxID=188144 RepID=UPI003551052C
MSQRKYSLLTIPQCAEAVKSRWNASSNERQTRSCVMKHTGKSWWVMMYFLTWVNAKKQKENGDTHKRVLLLLSAYPSKV